MATVVQVRVAEEELVTKDQNEKGSKELRSVRLGRADDLTLYEISPHELTQLEQGSPVSVLFNVATFAAGVFVSTLSVLLSVDFPVTKIWTFVVFVVLTIVAGAVTLVCTLVWLRFRQTNTEVVKRIRDRLKESTAGEPPSPASPRESPRPGTPPSVASGPTENDAGA